MAKKRYNHKCTKCGNNRYVNTPVSVCPKCGNSEFYNTALDTYYNVGLDLEEEKQTDESLLSERLKESYSKVAKTALDFSKELDNLDKVLEEEEKNLESAKYAIEKHKSIRIQLKNALDMNKS